MSRVTVHGDLGLIILSGAEELGKKVNEHLIRMRRENGENNFEDVEEHGIDEDFIVESLQTRFSNGEGKIKLNETVRGKDIYILADVSNYSITYDMFGHKVMMGPDEHFQDIKRVLSAMSGRARRVTVVMPLLYASRQHKKKSRESLDCAMALQDLERLGVDEIVTFDAHDPSIQNAIPLVSFLNVYPTLDILKQFLSEERWLLNPQEKLLVISPDTGAMDRAIYYASMLGLDVGMFYKRRDHSKVVNGKNPIVQHEYIGTDVKDLNVLIVDDMIASGESVIDIAKEVKKRGAKKVFVASTFAFFTEGGSRFTQFHEKGLINKVFSTNLNYVSDEVRNSSWFSQVDLSCYLAKIIDYLNHDFSISPLLDASSEIRKFLKSNGVELGLESMK